MALTSGTRLGPYEIVAAIGAGGMGEVYRARDTKLNRDVALKVLPEALATDPDRLARFHREAQVLAALNHPNIAHIHGFEDAGAVHAIVMELVEGPTLADMITGGHPEGESVSSSLRDSASAARRGGGAPRGLKIDDVLMIARQIADALEAAHEQGIIHRDLKPANVKVREDGTVKVLDFGLAKALDPVAEQSADMMNSPTLTARATQLGMILGTAAYMAPEQAKGKPVDRRADVWAFGVVLYEMLTGKRAFAGSDVSETLASVLAREPDWSAIPTATPVPIVKLIRQCLEKDRKERTPDIAVARFAIRDAQTGSQTAAAPAAERRARPFWREPATWVVAAIIALVAGGLGWWAGRPVPEAARVSRSSFELPAAPGNPTSRIVAMSPLGTAVAFIADSKVWLRRLDDLEPTLLTPNEDDARTPAFSPDGQQIAFGSGGRLKRVAITGGSVVDIGGPVPRRFPGLHWADDGYLYVGTDEGIARVPEVGGPLETVISNGADGKATSPFRLPESDWLLFTLATDTEFDKAKVVAESLATHERRMLVDGGYDARVVPGGPLLYFAGGTLFGRAFDRSRVTTSGGPVPLVDRVGRATGRATSDTNYGVSRRGDLVYIFWPDQGQGVTLALADRQGQQTALPIELDSFLSIRLSPDGKRVAAAVGESAQAVDVWLFDTERAGRQKLTNDGRSFSPAWSPDGQWVYYASQNPDGPGASVWRRRADLSGEAERVFTQPETNLEPYSMSRDGTRMGLQVASRDRSNYRAAVLDLHEGASLRFLTGEANWTSREPSLSPDGRFVAYASDETGGAQVYVQEVSSGPKADVPGRKRVISAQAATNPRWTADGKEIIFLNQGRTSYSVVRVISADRLEFSAPAELRLARVGPTMSRYDVSRDGTRLLVSAGDAANSQDQEVRLVLNWFEEVRAKLPVK